MAARTVRVLGDLSVDGLDLRAGLDRKARTLVRLLALARGRAVPTDALVEAIWPDRPPARPADQVAVLASRVRRLLGRDAVENVDAGYRLAGVHLDLDELETVVAETERRLDQGRPTAAVVTARIALALVRGPVGDPDADTDWARADHAGASRLVQRARRAATEAFQRAGAWTDAWELAHADLLADPYDEIAARAVMRAEAAAGRPARALKTYADLRAVLVDELGADPHPETESLHAELLRGGTPLPATTSPRPLLIGRSSQFDHLDSLAGRLGEGKVRVALVTGEAGIGKTTLLRAWTQARAEAGDVVLTGTCGSLDASAPLDVVLAAVDDHLRRHPEPGLAEETSLLGRLLGREHTDDVTPDPVLGPATLYAAVTRVLEQIAGERGVVLAIDDAHLAGPALGDWIEFAQRRPIPLLVVAAVRPAEGATLPASDEIGLGPFGLPEAEQLVGAERAAELLARSGGHPLFLSELAGAGPGELPASLVTAVRDRCEQLGDDAALIRTAALLGGPLDIELLAALLGLPALEVLQRVEHAAERGLLVERNGRYAFRHDLVRGALAADSPAARARLVHREAARVLADRPSADPLAVAEHAQLGGDDALAARALADAAQRAAARFDHATAERLLSESLDHADDPEVRQARARVLIRLGRYDDAEAAAVSVGTADASTTAAWAAYFGRRFADAVDHAEDARAAATDDGVLARALMAGGRVKHARGDLAGAEAGLRQAVAMARGNDRLTAAAWLGVLLAHRSRAEEAIELLRPATRPEVGVDHTSAALHALLFTGHAHALVGRPQQALDVFARYTEEVEHRQVPRFAGRGVNFGGWVLRNVGATDRGHDAHLSALDLADSIGTNELEVAVLEDLAEEQLHAGDPDAAAGLLERARTALAGDLVFGWRLALKLRLHEARLALLREEFEQAAALAGALRDDADALGVPRYSSVAAVLCHLAGAGAGEAVDRARVVADLDAVRSSVAIEAWWWTGETAAALGDRSLLTRAASLVADLAPACGEHADALRAEADRRIARWSLRTR